MYFNFVKKMNLFFIFCNCVINIRMMSNIVKKACVIPCVEDIKYFLSPGTTRGDNAESNKIRENIICNYDKCFIFKTDPEYGAHWTTVIEDLDTNLRSLCDSPGQGIMIEPMGGMKHNYDFNVTFIGSNQEVIKTSKLEFKHNNSSVSKIPQFLEIYDKDSIEKFNICDERYADYYYEHWLDKYLAIDNDPKIILLKPDKETYLKRVSDNTRKHLFFEALYLSYENNTTEKRKLARDSIRQYLEKFIDPDSLSSSFNFEKIANKIKESQTDKVYLMWDCTKFHTQVVNVADIQIKKIIKLDKLYFDVEVEQFMYNIRIRLNWGNNAGVTNPRWKFTFINK